MAFEEQITETIEAGAPSIKYEGDIQQQQAIAQQLWEQLPPDAKMQFGSFEQFFQSGAWKKVLQMLQQQREQQVPQQEAQPPQEGIGGMMPAQMADGGRLMASASDPLDDKNQISLSVFGKPLHELTPDELLDLDEYMLDKAQKWGGAYGGSAGGLGTLMEEKIVGKPGGLVEPGVKQYGILKKVFKKVTRPIKKVLKSDLGKAAALAAATYYGGGGNLFGLQRQGMTGFSLGNLPGAAFFGKGSLNPLMSGTMKQGTRQLAKSGLGNLLSNPWTWGAAATAAPFAMQAMGKWDTGEEELDQLKNTAAEFGFDYQQMIRDIQTAAASGSEAEVAKVMSNYNLSRSDMPGSKYIGTAAEGGRIGYAEGGWEAREKQALISKLVEMGLPLPQAMKMAKMIIANAAPEEIKRLMQGTRRQEIAPEESMNFQENIQTPTEDIDLTGQVSKVFPLDPRVQAPKEYLSLSGTMPEARAAMQGRMQQPEIAEMIMEKFRTPRGMEESVEEIREALPEWKRDAEQVPGLQEGGLMSLGGMEMDLRGGGFVPIGAKEKADDVPARLSKNEFVFTADAVRAAGGGDVDAGADKMYNTMKQLENRVG